MTATDAFDKELAPITTGDDMQSYPPSWVDCFTSWVGGLPFPRWTCYVGLWLAIFLPYSTLKWWDGAYPIGGFAYNFNLQDLTHHQDRASAMAAAPVLAYPTSLLALEGMAWPLGLLLR